MEGRTMSRGNIQHENLRHRKMVSAMEARNENTEPSSEEELYSADPTQSLLQDDDSQEFKQVADGCEGGEEFIVRKQPGEESSWIIALQVFAPFIIAGFGMVGAGMVLDVVQHWQVFQTIPEIFILVPALLGLKGNLEMTLASRLSTQANLGNMDCKKEQLKMIGGNLALTQAQAIVVGFLASMAAMVMGWVKEGTYNMHHALLLCASSVLTASVASLILGSIMVGVILLSRRCKINPDNVATPVAASLGDLTTLTLLSLIGRGLFLAIEDHWWIAPCLIAGFLLITPLWVIISIRNKYTNDVIYSGWTPVICAMVISSIGGLILDFAVSAYQGIAVYQPVINGVGGNLVAVQASRISTSLHQERKPGELPDGFLKGCPNPCFAFFGGNNHARAARVLMLLVIPGHLIFIYTIAYMSAGHTGITLNFSLLYLAAAVLQVAILLYVANWMVHYIWKKGDDPDNSAIPYLTALGDLLGTAFLATVFQILYVINNKNNNDAVKSSL